MRLLLILCCFLSVSCAYRTVTKVAPDVSDNKNLAFIQAHLLLGQMRQAKEKLDQIKESNQGREYWRLLSLYWLSSDNYYEALTSHKKGLFRYPNDDFILNNYGVLLGQKGLWDDACQAFEKAHIKGDKKRQSAQINLSRCSIRQQDVNLAEIYLKQAKEIADLPLIGLMTELNLVLIRGNNYNARIILNNIQASKKIAQGSVHFDEYNCLSWQLNAREIDPTQYLSASNFTCLNGSRY